MHSDEGPIGDDTGNTDLLIVGIGGTGDQIFDGSGIE